MFSVFQHEYSTSQNEGTTYKSDVILPNSPTHLSHGQAVEPP